MISSGSSAAPRSSADSPNKQERQALGKTESETRGERKTRGAETA